MGRVWLCTGRIAEHPLMLESEGVGLSSFEELCYYLYWNAELVGESFYNERLCQWLEEELGETELSVEIRAGIAQEESGCWCLERILEAGGFYNQAERQRVLQTVAWMEDKGPMERAKLRGDRLLREGRCREAVLAYRGALKTAGQAEGLSAFPSEHMQEQSAVSRGASGEDVPGKGMPQESRQPSQEAEVLGKIWHNMGTAYAYHMLFGQAAYCYGKAYEIGQEEASKTDYLMALSCRDGKVPEGGRDSLEGKKKALLAKKESGDRAGYEKMLEQTLEDLRTEYRERE
ncbi:MAG: hypothetical protein HFH39_04890 [Lachnospiraceae bacterium]|nr:hypothetical protein [Lachnospiraceae bacterium]